MSRKRTSRDILKTRKFVKHLSKRLTALKKRKNQYKYSTKRKTFSSKIQAKSIGINLKEMMLGLKKGKKTKHEIEVIINEAEAEVKLEILTTDKIKVKALRGLYFHQEITKTEAQELTPTRIVKIIIKRNGTFFLNVGRLQKNLKPS